MGNVAAALVVATHPQQCRALVRCIEELGLKPALAFTIADARHAFQDPDLSLVCCAPELLDGSYRDIVSEALPRALPVILLLRPGELRDSREALRRGVFPCLPFPFPRAEAKRLILRALGAAGIGSRAASA